uniref:Uncharacterized protein n=1 Tax=Arundo donax TaxID=35708 RepID=A0A0A9GYZ1_ARUDO
MSLRVNKVGLHFNRKQVQCSVKYYLLPNFFSSFV